MPVTGRSESQSSDVARAQRGQSYGAAHADPSDAYAGVPILNRPLWHGEIAAYFYLGGISSGAFVLGALADLAGERWHNLAQTAYAASFVTMVPCAPLLIHDLGKPSRFHHMMRIFKPSSPMNLGVWVLLAHSGFVTLQAARVLGEWDALPVAGAVARHLPAKALGAVGLPAALALGGYSGVLLGTTSVPLWSRSPLLGGLFMSSAMASGSAAVALASLLSHRDTEAEHAPLAAIGVAAGVAELALVGGYLATSGDVAAPLQTGADGALLRGAAFAAVAAIALELAGARSHRARGLFSAMAAGATLAGSAMLRWAVVHAGSTSAGDRDANLSSMRQTARNPGWGPPATGGGVP